MCKVGAEALGPRPALFGSTLAWRAVRIRDRGAGLFARTGGFSRHGSGAEGLQLSSRARALCDKPSPASRLVRAARRGSRALLYDSAARSRPAQLGFGLRCEAGHQGGCRRVRLHGERPIPGWAPSSRLNVRSNSDPNRTKVRSARSAGRGCLGLCVARDPRRVRVPGTSSLWSLSLGPARRRRAGCRGGRPLRAAGLGARFPCSPPPRGPPGPVGTNALHPRAIPREIATHPYIYIFFLFAAHSSDLFFFF